VVANDNDDDVNDADSDKNNNKIAFQSKEENPRINTGIVLYLDTFVTHVI